VRAAQPALALVAGIGLVVAVYSSTVIAHDTSPPRLRATTASTAELIDRACRTGNPYFALVRYHRYGESKEESPVIIAVHDTASTDFGENTDAQLTLATWGQTGTVSGLAYDWRRQAIYVAAYHKSDTDFGPGGPDAVYRVSLAGGKC